MSEPRPGTTHAVLIDDEVLRLVKEDSLSLETRVLLACLLYADAEGVATFNHRRVLRRWCGRNRQMATGGEVRAAINHLIEAGALAPGSDLLELRSMFGRAA